MKRVLLMALMAVGMLGVSCSKSGDDSPKPEENKTYLLKKVTGYEKDGNQTYGPYITEYSYDDKNRLTAITSESNFTKFSYDANGNLTKVEYDLGASSKGNVTYTYSGNKVTASNGNVFTLNDKKQVTSVAYETTREDYSYDASGNTIESKRFSNNQLTSTHSFKFDNKKHPLSMIGTKNLFIKDITAELFSFWGYEGLINNITEVNDGTVDSYKVTYQYNDASFPIKSTNGTYEETFEYIVK